MKRRPLGRTGLSVPEIGFGCGPTAGLMVRGDAETRRDVVARALELGIDYFDTAPAYGGTLSEQNLGETLRALGAKPLIATKIVLELERSRRYSRRRDALGRGQHRAAWRANAWISFICIIASRRRARPKPISARARC